MREEAYSKPSSVIEGIAKDTAAAPDMEEAEEVVEDEVSIS